MTACALCGEILDDANCDRSTDHVCDYTGGDDEDDGSDYFRRLNQHDAGLIIGDTADEQRDNAYATYDRDELRRP